MNNRIINNTLIYTVCAMVYLALLVPLCMAPSLYFPFVTGKAHMFRLIAEIAFACYLILAVRDRSYLPKKNLLLWATIGFTAILGLATIFAESPYHAFWSNFERMEGYVMILHLFGFFIAASSVLKGRKAWLYLLNTALVVSVIMGLEGFNDFFARGVHRIAGPLGNSSYLGVYALLHMFIAGFLLAGKLKGRTFNGTMWSSIAYIAVILFNGAVLYRTGTRGSFAGLVVGIVIIALLLAILERGMKRKIGAGFLVALVLVISFLGAFKNSSFIKNNDLLYRFSSLVTFNVQGILEEQGRARVLLWGTALKGVQERPVLGWGQDNFSYVFAKYYDSKMYDQEQWFDRTHDVFLDWLIAGGILALLGYLSLFYAVLYLMWKKPHGAAGQGEWNTVEKSVFTGMLAAYFVHNAFVFDNLASYIVFFVLLAYVAERYNASTAHQHNQDHHALVPNIYAQSVIVIIIIAAAVSSVYFVVWKPYMAGKYLINALQPNLVDAQGAKLTPEQMAIYRLQELKTSLGYKTFGNTEIRERLTDIASGALSQLATNSATVPDVVKDLNSLVASEYQAQLESTPNDARAFIFYGMYLQKINAYNAALPYIEKAISLSPTKQTFIFQKGTTLMALGKIAEAVAAFKTAYDIEPNNPEARILYGISLMYEKKFTEAKELLGSDMQVLGDERVLQAYLATGRYEEIIGIIRAKIAADPANGQLHMSLAGVYLKLKQGNNAIKEIQEAIKIEPQFVSLGNYYIQEIRAGRDPSTGPTPTQEQLDAASK